MKAIKNTYIKFGLTAIPVSITTLQQDYPIRFNNLCPYCKTQIKMKRYCVNCNKELNNYKELLKGYKISKSNCIILTQNQIENLKKVEDNGIEIKAFIHEDDIKFYYIDKIYNIIPTNYSKIVLKPFVLFKEALKLSGLCAIGKFVMRNREYICVIKHFEDRLFLITLIHPHRIELPEKIKEEVSEIELKCALEVIEKLKTTFNELHHNNFTRDEYYENFSNYLQGKLKTVEEQTKEFKEMIKEMTENANPKPHRKKYDSS
ncbi:MAG: hypothetical protein OH338_05030 [Candidatus Parvarchaeota archaeon]|nr:hypothetical protein [Candidatus Parvarchaeum tengchongense]